MDNRMAHTTAVRNTRLASPAPEVETRRPAGPLILNRGSSPHESVEGDLAIRVARHVDAAGYDSIATARSASTGTRQQTSAHECSRADVCLESRSSVIARDRRRLAAARTSHRPSFALPPP